MSGQSGGQRLQLFKLNDQLTCKLCGGYFIDATTIIECLHSFCRSCIVKYLENNKYCPICEVQVHKSKPLLNIRPDHTLQDIVYKLVPGCYQNEMRCRREFYSKHPEACTQATTPEARGEPTESHIYSPDESLSLSLEYFNPSTDAKGIPIKALLRRYLRCPAAVTIFHLQKLIRAKYGLTDAHRVDVMYKEEPLCSSYTLMDVMYIYHWRRKVPLHLSYRIFESSPKRIKLSEDNVNYKTSLLDAGIDSIELKEEKPIKREWKEVQLKISETGIMSITDISDQQFKKNARVEEPLTSVEKINTSAIQDDANKANMSETTEEYEHSSDKKDINESEVSSKLNEFDDKKNTNQAESVKISKNEMENVTISKYEKEFNNCLDNNNVEDKAALHKCVLSEMTQPLNENLPKNNNAENEDQKEAPKNNNNIISESVVDVSKQNAKSELKFVNTGSKINALSVKLQFQPKLGQPNNNNASSKKAAKDRKTIPESSRKIDSKIPESSKSAETKNLDTSKTQSMTHNCEVATSKSLVPCSGDMISQKQTSESQDNEKFDLSIHPNSSINSEVKGTEIKVKNVQSISDDVCSIHPKNSTEKGTCISDRNSAESSQRSNGHGSANSNSKMSPYVHLETLRNDNFVSPNTSTSLSLSVGNGINTSSTSTISQATSTFAYAMQDLVNSTMLKNSLKHLAAPITQKLSTTMVSVDQISTSSASESSSVFSIPSIETTTSKSNYTHLDISSSKESTSKASPEVSCSYTVPPCPDAIPISLMKPPVRKNELLIKGSNLNEICAKIGASGSKINDICAKIGENSKEKNKTEARNKSDIPDLLKIGRKNGSSSITIDSTNKQHQHANIPNLPVYEGNSNVVASENKNVYSYVKDVIRATSLVTTPVTSHSLQKVSSVSKKQSQAVSYKTLRDPPRSWNPTLSKNNYVAVKNQTKETQNQLHQNTLFERSKTIQSKPAKIFKMRNMPRYLGNPASGVKPMYGIGNECKEKEQSTMSSTTPTNTSTSSKNGNLNMMKIDPKTLSPIVSTVNSAIVSPPPYSPSARNYPSSPFPRDMCRSTGTPISPKNSPVNMLSTSPFIPSPTPNMNPRLIYPHFPPPFPDATRFPNPLIRPPIGIPSPSAFHSSLPPSINKLYQRSSYIPQTTGFSSVSQPPAVQRIPPSTYSSPKSPKTTTLTAISTASYNLVKPETQTTATTSHENNMLLPDNTSQEDISAFNLSKTGSLSNAENVKISSEIVRNGKSISLSPVPNTGNGKNTLAVPSKVKQDNFPPKTGELEQSKEQPRKETAKSKEQNLYSSKEQSAEKSRSEEYGDDVNKMEELTRQVNGDLTNKGKEERAANKNVTDQQNELNGSRVADASEKGLGTHEIESPKKEDCKNTEEQENEFGTKCNRTDT